MRFCQRRTARPSTSTGRERRRHNPGSVVPLHHHSGAVVQPQPRQPAVESLRARRDGGRDRRHRGGGRAIGLRSIYDIPTAVIAVVTFAILWRYKVPEPIVVVAAGIVGLLVWVIGKGA